MPDKQPPPEGPRRKSGPSKPGRRRAPPPPPGARPGRRGPRPAPPPIPQRDQPAPPRPRARTGRRASLTRQLPPRFRLERVGAPPVVLEPGKTFTVGRSSSCDLAIPSTRVSRVHAELTWEEDGAAVLQDCGSQNGTHVNGRRVEGRHRLADGDELEFGPYLCTYRCRPDRTDLDGMNADTNAVTKPMIVGDAMAGSLDQMSLAEVLQALGLNRKTGTLTVSGPEGDGVIVLDGGAPVFAEAADKEGLEAICALFLFRGQFRFVSDVHEERRNVSAAMDSVLLEGLRRLDETQG